MPACLSATRPLLAVLLPAPPLPHQEINEYRKKIEEEMKRWEKWKNREMNK
jgi:hypothetical protein